MTEDEASSLVGTVEADVFARALDALGWKIVQQEQYGEVSSQWILAYRWDDCPAWAENGDKAPWEEPDRYDAGEDGVVY
jgi:hypothetical protein